MQYDSNEDLILYVIPYLFIKSTDMLIIPIIPIIVKGLINVRNVINVEIKSEASREFVSESNCNIDGFIVLEKFITQ